MNIGRKSRYAIVTGFTAGIGRAIAKGLARAGAAVVIDGCGKHMMVACLCNCNEGPST